ncbi:FimV/HubP family polar landmark protein [Chitinibacter sp. FCG-7]|uniref:FimV/HubP family polar landmark protein n=1 Tax=Chitinibacter mangrovi TaxID=3153927 RepID=A0AAU7F9K5_9NEIS
MQKTPRFKACVLAVAMAALPLFGHAAGLGRLNVLSGLGQPFRGEIDLVSVQPNEADSLVVSLAPPESYSNARIEYPPASLGLRFNIEKRPNGQYYVVVNSSLPIAEPFLDLLVELNWATGRIQREYTALIDPADYAGGVNSSDKTRYASSDLPGTQTRGGIKGAKPKRTKPVVSNQTPVNPSRDEVASSSDAASASTATDSHRVRSGETLGSIARQVQPSGVSLEQVLVGLYKANPSAFDGNMNRLKSGKILNVPSAAQLQQTSKSEAAKEIQVQAADWSAYRGKLAESVSKGPAKVLSEQSGAGKITAKVQDQGANTSDANKDVLKLSKAADAAKKSGDQAKLKALEEEIATRQKALDEANQRVAALQKNVSDMEKLATLKAGATASPVATAQATSDPALVASAASEVASEASSEVVASAVATAKPKRRVQVEAPVAEEPGLFDGLLDNSLALGGGALALVLGGAGLLWARRRQNPGVFEDSIITGGDLKANTVLGSTGGGVISTQATENSFLTDFSRQGLGTIDTDEVDPIAEAEVYMAYGRDAQAEEILKDALHKDPSRHEIRMKLLDIYAARRDATSYEEHASSLFAVTNGQGDLWREAAANGRAIDPENPLYRKEPAGVVDTSLAAPAVVVGASALEEVTAPDLSAVASNELDFELDFDAEQGAAPEALDLSVSPVDLDLAVEASPSPAEATLDAGDDLALDAALDLDVVEPENAPIELAASADDALLSLDLPIDTGSAAEELSAIDQLLDLDLDAELNMSAPEASAITAANDLTEDFAATTELDAFGGFELGADKEAAQLAELPAESLPIAEDLAAEEDDLKLDFNFDLESAEEVSAFDVASASEAPALDLDSTGVDSTFGDISLDLSEAAAAGDLDFAADDPVQTKIDLAKAYIDMGDVEGAREILQEALQEGSDAQQQLAKTLLADL